MIMVTYDLNRPGQNYRDLIEAIKGLGCPWCHCLKSAWLLDTRLSAQEVSDLLVPHIDQSDYLLVIEVNPDGSQGWMLNEVWDWINGRRAA